MLPFDNSVGGVLCQEYPCNEHAERCGKIFKRVYTKRISQWEQDIRVGYGHSMSVCLTDVLKMYHREHDNPNVIPVAIINHQASRYYHRSIILYNDGTYATVEVSKVAEIM